MAYIDFTYKIRKQTETYQEIKDHGNDLYNNLDINPRVSNLSKTEDDQNEEVTIQGTTEE